MDVHQREAIYRIAAIFLFVSNVALTILGFVAYRNMYQNTPGEIRNAYENGFQDCLDNQAVARGKMSNELTLNVNDEED